MTEEGSTLMHRGERFTVAAAANDSMGTPCAHEKRLMVK